MCLRGFGRSDKHPVDPAEGYSAVAQARSVVALIDEFIDGNRHVASSLAGRAPDLENRIGTPTSVLWPEFDPLFPRAWSDRLGEFFSEFRLHTVGGAGHFTPVECPAELAGVITDVL